jgi:molybdate/tungstate transport system ATP-binding protein
MILLRDITVAAGAFILRNVSLSLDTGNYGVLMGRTGSGKTTLLEAICGLRPVNLGEVRIHGKDVTALSPAARGIGYVPQDGALFATHTVEEHLAFALRLRKWPATAIRERVAELAEALTIGHLLARKPHGLSGGEKQRVALGRALSFKPKLMLLDEPLSALDHEARQEIIGLLCSLKQQFGVTVLHVTHDRNEAARLADQLFLLEAGAVKTVTSADSFNLPPSN